MLSKTSRIFRIIAVVEGAYETDYLPITNMLRSIRATCPILFRRIVQDMCSIDENDDSKKRKDEELDQESAAQQDKGAAQDGVSVSCDMGAVTDKVAPTDETIFEDPIALENGIPSEPRMIAPIRETSRNTKAFPTRLKKGDWMRGLVEDALSLSPLDRLPPTYPTFNVRYYKKFSVMSMRAGGHRKRFVFRNDRPYGIYEDGLVSFGFIDAFLEVSEGLKPLHFAIVRKLRPLQQDRVLDVDIFRSPPRVLLKCDSSNDQFDKETFRLVDVNKLVHRCEHFLPYKGLDPSTSRVAKSKADRANLWWRSPWYRRSY